MFWFIREILRVEGRWEHLRNVKKMELLNRREHECVERGERDGLSPGQMDRGETNPCDEFNRKDAVQFGKNEPAMATRHPGDRSW